MDLAFIIGQAAVFFMVALGIIVGGAGIFIYVDIPSVFITIGGTVATAFIGYGSKAITRDLVAAWRIAITNPSDEAGSIIDSLVTFSEKARREGLLALEDDMSEVQDPFLKKGLELVVDGTDPELVRKIMRTELDFLTARHDKGKGMFDDMATLAPAFGMIGTLVGLIAMLANLEDKAAVGAGMSAALITTLYGAILANGVFIPTSNRLRNRHEEEMLLKEMMIEGTVSIQQGDNPRIVKEKLLSFLPPAIRDTLDKEEGAAEG